MLNEATWRYVGDHANDDVRRLALQGPRSTEVDLKLALQQIQGRQTARKKLPTWAATEGILYPQHLSMEQCSSEQTARYKADIAAALPEKNRLIDLTGGFGVDFAWMSEVFTEAIYVEQQADLYATAKANFATLGLKGVSTVCADSVDYLHKADRASLIYIDPARRNDNGGRTYSIGDCTPNILPLLDEVLTKSSYVMLKLSPMLDWRKAVSDVGKCHVEQVHIVAVGNECKELLLLLAAKPSPHPILVCTNDASKELFPLFTPVPPLTPSTPLTPSAPLTPSTPSPPSFLFEPNAALMKAGVFAALANRYTVSPLAPNSHLFTSAEPVPAFPGRQFHIMATSSMNKQELKTKILPLHQANISCRNFPLSVAELRRRLKLSEGGSNYLFATTLAGGEHVLIVCQHL